ncbi:MAGUK p55 subfamily member 7-like [Cololabis saira]|uniref:MAGUK p55 subfamily member 7-like n=1 Tax=Cololabis saira TaxID=129043 RepID=UPI002AD21F74|nr:MAGUK p55 subfamily member 7-like [Cololabis saira]
MAKALILSLKECPDTMEETNFCRRVSLCVLLIVESCGMHLKETEWAVPPQSLTEAADDAQTMDPSGFLPSPPLPPPGPSFQAGEAATVLPVMSAAESHSDREEDYRFLHSMLMEKKVHLLFKIHERLKRFGKRSPVPVQEHAESLASDLGEELLHQSWGEEVGELVALFSKPHFKSLLHVHDSVAQRDFQPTLPPIPDDVLEEEEDSVKIVSLVKTQEPLGATIKKDKSTGAILVARIMKGGAADKSGLIHEGDELREVNGVSLEHRRPKEILALLAGSQGEVKFKIIPGSSKEDASSDKAKLFVQALFDYDPAEDPSIPCKEAAVAFKRGDILQIVNMEDEIWWQACRLGDGNGRAGLIPSKQLHERRVALQRPRCLFQPEQRNPSDEPEGTVALDLLWEICLQLNCHDVLDVFVLGFALGFKDFSKNNSHATFLGRRLLCERLLCCSSAAWKHSDNQTGPSNVFLSTPNHHIYVLSKMRIHLVTEDVDYGAITGIHVAGLRRSFRLSRRSSRSKDAARVAACPPTYREVVPYHRESKDRHRLVVLVGTPGGVGVNELKRRLAISDPDRYGVSVPYTTREKGSRETEGVDYHFAPVHLFEEHILNNRFVDYGHYRGHYYGTSVDSVHGVMAEGKMCLLDLHPSKIKHVFTSEFKPYVVFVKPPLIEELRLTRRRAKFVCNEEGVNHVRIFSEEDFEDMIALAETMENHYSHLFDKLIVNGDIATAFRELKADLERIADADVHWVPAQWICSPPATAAGHLTG